MWMLPMAHCFVVSILHNLRYGATILLPRSYLAGPILEFVNSHAATAERFFARMGIALSQVLGVIEIGFPAINLMRPREKPLSPGQVLPVIKINNACRFILGREF